METWMYGLIAVPVVAVAAAYGLGAFSTNTPAIDAKIADTRQRLDDATAFEGDIELNRPGSGGRRKKTKKSKSKNKKTKRRR